MTFEVWSTIGASGIKLERLAIFSNVEDAKSFLTSQEDDVNFCIIEVL